MFGVCREEGLKEREAMGVLIESQRIVVADGGLLMI